MNDLISRKEAIEALCQAGCGSGYCGISCDDVKAIERLPSAQRWIPVSERLPEPNSAYKDVLPYYLVQNEYGEMMVATFIISNGEARVWQQIYQYGEITDEIVAWMPLPEPWKGGEDE